MRFRSAKIPGEVKSLQGAVDYALQTVKRTKRAELIGEVPEEELRFKARLLITDLTKLNPKELDFVKTKIRETDAAELGLLVKRVTKPMEEYYNLERSSEQMAKSHELMLDKRTAIIRDFINPRKP